MKPAKSEDMDWLESNRFAPEPPLSEWQPNPRMVLYWIGIAALAGFWLAGEWLFAFFLFFTAGWANGWPLGLSFQLVLSVVMTGYMSLMLMTAAIGVGAIIGYLAASAGVREARQWQLYRRWLCFAASVIVCLGIIVFFGLYAWARTEFPDGYSISQARLGQPPGD
jgi:hypothetical protein